MTASIRSAQNWLVTLVKVTMKPRVPRSALMSFPRLSGGVQVIMADDQPPSRFSWRVMCGNGCPSDRQCPA